MRVDMADKKEIKLIITFAERGKGKALAKYYAEQGVTCSYQCMGRGTASSDLLDVLGVGTAEKDILISYAVAENALRLLQKLDAETQGEEFGKGLVFDMPLTGINNLVAAALFQQQNGAGGAEMERKADLSLILIAVNQGHTDAVMDTAREAGARGGTIIRARWAGPEEEGKFHGISVQPEKEIIAIVASGDQRKTIMEMVNKKHGVKTEAGAVITSVGIDHSVRLA